MLLIDTGQKARYIFKDDQGNIEAVAEPDKAGGFATGIDIQDACQYHRLVGDDADAKTSQTGKANDDVFREVFLYFVRIRHHQRSGEWHL